MSDYDWDDMLNPLSDNYIRPYRNGQFDLGDDYMPYSSSGNRSQYQATTYTSTCVDINDISINNKRCKDPDWKDRPCEYVCSFCHRTIPERCGYFEAFKQAVIDRKITTCPNLYRSY